MSILTDQLQFKRSDAYEQRRFGRFYMSLDLLMTHADVVQKIFSKVIPLHMEYDITRELFEIRACSDEFDPLELPTAFIPMYQVFVRQQKRNKGGTGVAYYVSFEKIEE